MHCKLHEYLRQAAFLSLRLRKTKVAQHRHILNFNNTQLPLIQFTSNGTDRNNPQTIRMLQKQLDTFRTSQIHQNLQRG